MHTAILLLTVMVALLVGSGVALAAVITCPTDPGGECWGTTLADRITGTSGWTRSTPSVAKARCKVAVAMTLSRTTSAPTLFLAHPSVLKDPREGALVHPTPRKVLEAWLYR